jgi:sodium/proline symporter
MTASTPLLITFGIYLLAMVGIGFVAWKRTRDFDDYILGGRSLGGYVTALSAGASDMSGWLLMGLPGSRWAWSRGRGPTGASWPGRCASTPSAATTR